MTREILVASVRDRCEHAFMERWSMSTASVTSAHVARLAGVSRATVSRVFNGSSSVSAELSRRVYDAVQQLGYEPDQAARSLVSKTSRTIVIGFFAHDSWGFAGISQPAWHFYLSVLRDIENETRAAGFDLLLPSQPRGQGAAAYVRGLRARRAAGVIIAGTTTTDARVSALIEAEIPTVFIDSRAHGPRAAHVVSDNETGAEEITRYVLGLGHRRVAVLTGQEDELATSDRLSGTRRALASVGVSLDDVELLPTDWSTEEGFDRTARLLDRAPGTTAIVAHSDMLALGAMHAVRQRGLVVGRDVSVSGFDDVAISGHLDPGLTTVRQDSAAIGEGSVSILIDMIDRGRVSPQSRVVKTELVIRGSTGPAHPIS